MTLRFSSISREPNSARTVGGLFRCSLAAVTFSMTAWLPAFEEGELLVWINGDKGYRGLAEIGRLFEEELGIPVKVEAPEGATDKFQQAAQSGQGPDIFFWPHDRLGEWADAGLLQPIDVSDNFKADYFDKGWEAFMHQGKLWGYPVSLEAVALVYNKDLVIEPPRQLEEAVALQADLKAKGADAILWDYQNTYFSWGVMASDGGYVFGKTPEGEYDPNNLGVNNAGAVAGLKEIVALIEADVMPKGASYSVMEGRMNSGEVAMMINGPWSWANLRKSGIDFGVAAVPGVNGKPGRPFVGVLGAMLNRSSPNAELAVEFLEYYVLTDDGLGTIDKDVPLGVPAKRSLYESLAATDPLIEASMENVDNGVIMPNIPEMGRFWSSMEAAMQIATNGQASPEKALNDAANNMK